MMMMTIIRIKIQIIIIGTKKTTKKKINKNKKKMNKHKKKKLVRMMDNKMEIHNSKTNKIKIKVKNKMKKKYKILIFKIYN